MPADDKIKLMHSVTDHTWIYFCNISWGDEHEEKLWINNYNVSTFSVGPTFSLCRWCQGGAPSERTKTPLLILSSFFFLLSINVWYKCNHTNQAKNLYLVSSPTSQSSYNNSSSI